MAEPYYASKHVLERALENVGDEETLAELLGIHLADLSRWMLGRQLPPPDVFLCALDLAFKRTAPVGPADRGASHQRPIRGPSSP
jgi:hypothetical protein